MVMTDQSNMPAPPLAEPAEHHNPDHIAAMARGIDPVPVRTRLDGWTPERQREFIAALGACGVVAEAAARVGMSARSAYKLRARPGARSFREAWEVAVDSAMERLADAVFARALHGVSRPIFYQGEQVGERRHYDERLAMFLLSRRAPDRFGSWIDRREVRCDADEHGAALAEALDRVTADALAQDAAEARAVAGDAPDRAEVSAAGAGSGAAVASHPAGDSPSAPSSDPEEDPDDLDTWWLEEGEGEAEGQGDADAAAPERPPLPRPAYYTDRQVEERREIRERVPTAEEVDAQLERKLEAYARAQRMAAERKAARENAAGQKSTSAATYRDQCELPDGADGWPGRSCGDGASGSAPGDWAAPG
jgi:hypothetical protein